MLNKYGLNGEATTNKCVWKKKTKLTKKKKSYTFRDF